HRPAPRHEERDAAHHQHRGPGGGLSDGRGPVHRGRVLLAGYRAADLQLDRGARPAGGAGGGAGDDFRLRAREPRHGRRGGGARSADPTGLRRPELMSVVNVPLKDGPAAAPRGAIDSAAEARMFRRPSEWRIFWEAFSRDRLALAAALVLLVVCLAPARASGLGPYDPTVGNNDLRLAPIGTPAHLFGLDGQGRDILSRLLWGGQV